MSWTAFCNLSSDDDEEHAVAYADFEALVCGDVAHAQGHRVREGRILELPLQTAFDDAVGGISEGEDGYARARRGSEARGDPPSNMPRAPRSRRKASVWMFASSWPTSPPSAQCNTKLSYPRASPSLQA